MKDYQNLGYKSLAKKFNITISQARTIKNSMEVLLSTKNSEKENKQIRLERSDKYEDFYGELIYELRKLRSEGFPTSFLDIKTCANFIKSQSNKFSSIKITDHFVRTFIRNMSLKSVKIYETEIKINENEVEIFFRKIQRTNKEL